MEAKLYYTGLPSTPVLVARSSTTPWVAPAGPEAYLKPKELRPVYGHALQKPWEGNLPHKLRNFLDSRDVKWTSIDPIGIGNVGESSAPLIIWIGVLPKSLPRDEGVVVASKCKELLVEHNIADVDVEIRESVVRRTYAAHSQTPSNA
jgi:hypothetical protein